MARAQFIQDSRHLILRNKHRYSLDNILASEAMTSGAFCITGKSFKLSCTRAELLRLPRLEGRLTVDIKEEKRYDRTIWLGETNIRLIQRRKGARTFMGKQYHIQPNTVQETLVIPLYARKVCMEKYPDLFADRACEELIHKIDYNFEKNGKKVPLFGCLEGGVRQYDLAWEVKDYLTGHPSACVVNLGCGLDTTFEQIDNGKARGYNLDMPDVIALRNELLPAGEREKNIACDLNDTAWFDEIDFTRENGAVFIAGGVFYYFTKENIKKLFSSMASHFKGGRLACDVTNKFGLKLMLKTWIKGAEIKDVGAYFSVKETEKEIAAWSADIEKVRHKKYMTGYRRPDKRWGVCNRFLCWVADNSNMCQIAQISFRG